MILVVGLGNPGLAYENTRHNAGFMLIDKIVCKQDLQNTSFFGELYKKEGVLYLKPSTFMNLSGKSVQAVNAYYKCDKIIVIHDDIDLKLGTLRFKMGGSSGGHNGLKSIDDLLGNEYERIRLGVGKASNVSKHVLGRFSKDEEEVLQEVLGTAKAALNELLQNKELSCIQAKYSLKS